MKRLLLTALLALGSPFATATATAQTVERSQSVVYIDGAKYYIHTVRTGDTLYAIARTYGVSEQTLLRCNPGAADGLRVDQSIKIPFQAEALSEPQTRTAPAARTSREEKRLKKTFIEHRVEAGETLYAISRRYEISVDTILEDNPETDARHLRIGQTLLIRKKSIGRTDEATAQREMESYAERLNERAESAGEDYVYYVVQPHETIYSLSRRYGMTEAAFVALNDLHDGLKAGAVIRVPAPGAGDAPEGAPEEAGEEAGENKEDLYGLPLLDTLAEAQPAHREIVFQALRPSEPLRIALLLPLTNKGAANANFTAFYQGFLLGLEEMKGRGYSADITLFDTQRDLDKVERIIGTEAFQKARLIVGPVYADGMAPVLRHAEERGIPVVSPLADMSGMNSGTLFQMAPAECHKYDKLRPLIQSGAAITLIRTPHIDKEFEAEVLAQLEGVPYKSYNFQSVQGAEQAKRSDLTPLLKEHEQHLFFVLSDNEVDVDRILASLSSAQTNLQARSQSVPAYTVVGSTRWNRYANIDRTTFFKNRVVLFSNFHAKRDCKEVRDFDTRYIRAFASMPTLYAYRGYETALIFCPGMYSDIEYDMEGRRYKPLQSTYAFGREPGSLSHVNQEWVRVNYSSDFTITIE